LVDLRITNRDKSFWIGIFFIMALVGISVVVVFFPIFEMQLCTDTGCTDVHIQKSLWDMYMENKVSGGFGVK